MNNTLTSGHSLTSTIILRLSLFSVATVTAFNSRSLSLHWFQFLASLLQRPPPSDPVVNHVRSLLLLKVKLLYSVFVR
ncbi:hypothetical protein BT93_E1097 [Corymbia citriodora subsp. variegata]|nr:hypothetical protein BT93_E1097 [Corymbia citriodora subsp. variegata]